MNFVSVYDSALIFRILFFITFFKYLFRILYLSCCSFAEVLPLMCCCIVEGSLLTLQVCINSTIDKNTIVQTANLPAGLVLKFLNNLLSYFIRLQF